MKATKMIKEMQQLPSKKRLKTLWFVEGERGTEWYNWGAVTEVSKVALE